MNRHTGFTLVEVLVVVAILSILTAIAWPGYARHVVKARRTEARKRNCSLAWKRRSRCGMPVAMMLRLASSDRALTMSPAARGITFDPGSTK